MATKKNFEDIRAKIHTPFNSMDEMMDALDPLIGLGTSDFETGKTVSLRAATALMRYQCIQFDGNVDESEFTEMCRLLKEKRVSIV